MIDMFRANWDGGALTEPTSYSIGYHPMSFSETFFSRLDEALTEIDRHLATKGAGPVDLRAGLGSAAGVPAAVVDYSATSCLTIALPRSATSCALLAASISQPLRE